MKFSTLIISIFLMISCAIKTRDSENNTISTKSSSGFPVIDFDTEAHDFGKIEAGERVLYSFIFTNTGNADLAIEKAGTDCGCIHVKFPQNPVSPGKKGIIEIEFDSSGMSGNQFKTVELHSNCKEPKHLVIFAQVENELIEIKY